MQPRDRLPADGLNKLGDGAALALIARITALCRTEGTVAHREQEAAGVAVVQAVNLLPHGAVIGLIGRAYGLRRALIIGQHQDLHSPLPVGAVELFQMGGGSRGARCLREQIGDHDQRPGVFRHGAVERHARQWTGAHAAGKNSLHGMEKDLPQERKEQDGQIPPSGQHGGQNPRAQRQDGRQYQRQNSPHPQPFPFAGSAVPQEKANVVLALRGLAGLPQQLGSDPRLPNAAPDGQTGHVLAVMRLRIRIHAGIDARRIEHQDPLRLADLLRDGFKVDLIKRDEGPGRVFHRTGGIVHALTRTVNQRRAEHQWQKLNLPHRQVLRRQCAAKRFLIGQPALRAQAEAQGKNANFPAVLRERWNIFQLAQGGPPLSLQAVEVIGQPFGAGG